MLKQVSQTTVIRFNSSSYMSLEIIVTKKLQFRGSPSHTIIYVWHSVNEFYTLLVSVEKHVKHNNNQEVFLCAKN